MNDAKKAPVRSSAPDRLPVAHSYLRFSTPKQQWGGSTRRQVEGTQAWSARSGIPLSDLAFADKGVSALRGKQRSETAALGRFLEFAKKGDGPVRRGDYLVIENLDRLSREEERTALRLWLDILDAGVNIVQLSPETIFRHERSDMTDIIRAIIELSRGHSESRLKSKRIGDYWDTQRKHARNGRLLTTRLPAWVKIVSVERDSYTLAPISERAETIRLIFDLAANGYGLARIVKRLNADGVPAWGRLLDEAAIAEYVERHKADGAPVTDEELAALHRPGHWVKGRWLPPSWNTVYIGYLLNDRRVLGEYVPKKGGEPDGEPLRGYFPAVVSEETFLKARAATERRKRRRGSRIGRHVDLFAGLIRDARDRGAYYSATRREDFAARERRRAEKRTKKGKAPTGPGVNASRVVRPFRVLANLAATQGRGTSRSFPLPTFERAILSKLAELDEEDVLGAEGSDDDAAIEKELGAVRGRLAELAELLAAGSAPRLFAAEASRLEAREAELVAKWDEARERAAKPLSESWRELKKLAGLLDDGDARLRLRAALGRVVEEIRLLVVPRGRDRLAEAQVWFVGGKTYRSYLIIHRPPLWDRTRVRPGRWKVRSIRHPEAAEAGLPFDMEDLRDPDQASCVQGYLEALPQEIIDRLLASGYPLP